MAFKWDLLFKIYPQAVLLFSKPNRMSMGSVFSVMSENTVATLQSSVRIFTHQLPGQNHAPRAHSNSPNSHYFKTFAPPHSQCVWYTALRCILLYYESIANVTLPKYLSVAFYSQFLLYKVQEHSWNCVCTLSARWFQITQKHFQFHYTQDKM